MHRFPLVALSAWLIAAGSANAQQAAENHLDALPRASSSTTTVTPIFSQLLMWSLPKDFRPLGDEVIGGTYLQQSVPAGQDAKRWTEMITVTGEKDAALVAGVSAQKLAERIAGYFRQLCPDSFRVASFGPVKVERHDGFAMVLSCGIADAATQRSETLLVVAIQGERDFYTLQWSERGAGSKTAIPIDAPRWQDRLARIAPVKLCPIVPGEAEPYPSCTGKR